ncbi:MAG: nitrogenase iron-molybdenum cofactor biosynthesis protein NifE [Nitrospirota bacterium]
MLTGMDKLLQSGCETEKKDKVCRSRGGESCAFDGAMIVLQPIADAAHIVHGPIACCGNSWEGRGTLSSKGDLHKMGFTTDMGEMDIVYGSAQKLYDAIVQICENVKPKAAFVYATCVSGLIGEDIEAVCKKAESALGIRVIPVNAPGFVGPKNLGNRIAGEVLLDSVIGTGEPSVTTDCDINIIGEYNIAGDQWLFEPLLKEAGIRVLSRITGDSTFEEITYAHRAKLNVVVCSRALINIAREMERKYGIPHIEVSFFGKTEIAKALRLIASNLESQTPNSKLMERVETIIAREERLLEERLKPYEHLRGKKAVLYTGGVKSWSFISVLLDLGIELVAIGTKKSTFEDEEKMKEILGENAPLVEDVAPKNLLKLLKEKGADMLVAGGRNQYLAVKEGYPFVDVNQERHTAYAGYQGLVNLAEQLSNGIKFYGNQQSAIRNPQKKKAEGYKLKAESCLINPLKHSQSIGAAIALQGIHRALPILHGAQGCTFLAKVLLTKHFKEPIALASTKLFTENVVMESEEHITGIVQDFVKKQNPGLIGILTSGLSEVKGDNTAAFVKQFDASRSSSKIISIATPDYEGGMETGYAKAVEAILDLVKNPLTLKPRQIRERQINVLVGCHLTPADIVELRETIESFALRPVVLPDLSALDGSRQGMSALALGGTTIEEIESMGSSEFTLAIGMSMEAPARKLKERFGVEYKVLGSIAGLKDTDVLMETLSLLSGTTIPARYERQRRILLDGMRDAHFFYGSKKICCALEPDLAIQTSRLLEEMGVWTERAVVPQFSSSLSGIRAKEIMVGDLSALPGNCDLIISNSHAADTAQRLNVPLYQLGFPVYKILGKTAQVTIGYRGSLSLVNEIANAMGCGH